jgi:hypothetical protein
MIFGFEALIDQRTNITQTRVHISGCILKYVFPKKEEEEWKETEIAKIRTKIFFNNSPLA